jgi:hypothetical protein
LIRSIWIPSRSQGYLLSLAHPYKGSKDQKTAVVREALVRMPLLAGARQFRSLGDTLPVAVRKAATLVGVENYEEAAISPLVKWASTLGTLEPGLVPEDLLDEAEAGKLRRHETDKGKVVAFLSHSSKDKPIIRQLAADLTAAGVTVWLDEQDIRVGDSIPAKIAQGLAESDYFVIALSESSVKSSWVQHELNNALVAQMAKRKVKILPIKLAAVQVPDVIADRKYADFSQSYNADNCSELFLQSLGTAGMARQNGDLYELVATEQPNSPHDISSTVAEAASASESTLPPANMNGETNVEAKETLPPQGAIAQGQPSARSVIHINVNLDSSLDTEKLQKQLELLRRFGAL